MQDAEHSISVLGQLKELGVRLSIDDFGTGYSSLSSLKRFPIDTVKIDRSFVRDVTDDPDDAAIIAEGVETEEQLKFLTDHGCPEVQGFLFSKPKPAEAFGLGIGGRLTVQTPSA